MDKIIFERNGWYSSNYRCNKPEDNSGEYVKYSDAQELERKLNACREALEQCHKNMDNGVLVAADYKLRIALEGIFETKF